MFTVEITISDSRSPQQSRHDFLVEAEAAGLLPVASTVSCASNEPCIQLDYPSREDAYAAAWTLSSKALQPTDRLEVVQRELPCIWRVRVDLSSIDIADPSSSPAQEWRAFCHWVASHGAGCNTRPLNADIAYQAYGCLDFCYEHQARRIATAAPHNLSVDRDAIDVVELEDPATPTHHTRRA